MIDSAVFAVWLIYLLRNYKHYLVIY